MSRISNIIAATRGGPVTPPRLARDLASLGVIPGMQLLVHSSLAALGYVPGGAPSVIEALLSAVGPAGLVVMPGFTSELSEPKHWVNPPVPDEWYETLRREMPPFDPRSSPVRGVGIVPDCFRNWPGAHRSSHPQDSFIAWGEGAEALLADQPLSAPFGPSGPLGRLYDKGAQILFLGTGFVTCTAFHLAEHFSGRLKTIDQGAPVRSGGERVWLKFELPDYDTDDFDVIGDALERETRAIKKGPVGIANCRLFPIREAVDFAARWMKIR